MRVCRNSHKLKISLATTICGEGDFDKRGVLAHSLNYDQSFSTEPGGFMSAIQTSAMLSRRIWRKLHFSVEAKYLFLPERATQTFEKRNLLTGEIEDSYSKRVRVHYLEMACGISWHL